MGRVGGGGGGGGRGSTAGVGIRQRASRLVAAHPCVRCMKPDSTLELLVELLATVTHMNRVQLQAKARVEYPNLLAERCGS